MNNYKPESIKQATKIYPKTKKYRDLPLLVFLPLLYKTYPL
jgi:hypothetical protein